MPSEGLEWLKRQDLLSYEEIEQIVPSMGGMGLRRVRITGGEPLVRRDLPDLVKLLSAIPEIEDLSLSTNAVLLADASRRSLVSRHPTVKRLLDSLRPYRVDAIARRPGSFQKIMEGLDAPERTGSSPIKINVVLIRGQNDDEITDSAEITRERLWHLRFIKLMPTGANLGPEREPVRLLCRCAPAGIADRCSGAGCGPVRKRPGSILASPGCTGDLPGHRADTPQLLRSLQSDTAEDGRATASLPLRGDPRRTCATPSAPARI